MKTAEQVLWNERWWQAWRNCGYNKTRVMVLLGCKTRDRKGRNYAAQQFTTNANRGSKPRDERQQRLLTALAGPYGSVIARAIAAQKGLPPLK